MSTPTHNSANRSDSFTTISKGADACSHASAPSAAGEKPAGSCFKKNNTLLRQARNKIKARFYFLRVPPEKTRPRLKEAGITTASEGENESLLSFFLNAVGAKPASDDKEAGFTMLFAVIVTSVVVLLGITIAGIYQREAMLSATSQASSEAFYAADEALECAMYHDQSTSAFATSSATGDVNCAGDNVSAGTPGGPYPYVYNFELDDTDGADICAEVEVRKYLDGGRVITEIEARGRNTCLSSNRQAERALRTAY